MPLLSRLFIKSGFIYLIMALLMAVGIETWPFMTPAYIHALTVGWISQLIIGVSFWFFPRYSKEEPRGNERLGWACFWLLNCGLLLRIVIEPLSVISTTRPGSYLLVTSAVSQWLAALLYVIMIWPRVKKTGPE